MQSAKTLQQFRIIAWAEGISYLLLLLIAMPLKYIWGFEMAVKWVGWAHGILFMLYCFYLALCWYRYKWSFWLATLGFIASLLPFGPFLFDRKLHR